MTGEATALRQEGLPAIGEVIAQKYRVEGVVGSGGMGVVVAARHLQLGQVVAIKLLSAPEESRRVEANTRFIREAQAAAGLRSDHVVRIYDVGMLDSGLPFMVMELLRGSDLGTLLDTHGTLQEAQAVDFVLQACDAISEAHQAGIVHRDLKPSNLFVTQRSDGSPLLKVLDFGISKAIGANNAESVEGNLTSTRAVMGSPYYMSPEQVRDARKVDARTDIWALGVILHELLTGEPAFQADTFPGVCAAIVADPPLAVRARRPDVSPALEAVVMRCLDKDVTRRFQSVPELIAALLPFSSRASAMSGNRATMGTSLGPVAVVSAPVNAFSESATLSYDAAVTSPRGGRVITGDTKTQLSADLLSAPTTPVPAISRKRRRFVVGGAVALLTFGAAAAAGLLSRPSPAESSRQVVSAGTVTSAPASEPFTMVIDSTPAGAEVMEGEQRLGLTPMTMTLALPAGSQARSFQVRKDGFRAYSFEQGPARGEVRVHAALIAEEAAPDVAVVSPAPPVTVATGTALPQPRRPAQQSGRARRPATASSATPPASDIRLQR